jgi:hypothetical protein
MTTGRRHRLHSEPRAATPKPTQLPGDGATQSGRLTRHVVFFMLIGWLVVVVLVVILISVT